MKHLILLFISLFIATACNAANSEEPSAGNPETTGLYFQGKKVLIAYFSWGGTTQRMAEAIQEVTEGDLFEIEPVVPYPTEYTPCTEVALQERDNDERPAIKDKVADWNQYDVIFIGCPVWWHTAPMIINTFCESYDFSGNTVVPFCTYAATYRNETLQKIVDLTPAAEHLEGLGTRGSTSEVQSWIDIINEQYNNLDSNQPETTVPMSGKVDLYIKGNIPTVTNNVDNSDGPDFIPNMEVFTVSANIQPKGAVIICPGGAFIFRSMQSEGYDIASMLVPMGYQCFVINYRINPYTMQESATDLQRAIRYVRAHADDYRINPENIALVGFSAGGILNGEVLLNWRDLKNGTALDPSYIPDDLDNTPVSACAVGMIYSFYGRLSVSMNNVETLRAADLPPAFYCWGTRDGFAGQFTQNANAVEEAGCRVERKILQNYPHGYGTGGGPSVWGTDFDAFLSPIMEQNSSSIESVSGAPTQNSTLYYDLNGRQVAASNSLKGIYIAKTGNKTQKILK